MTLRHPPLRYRTSCQGDDRLAEARGIVLGFKIGALIWLIFLTIWWLS